MLVEFRFKNYRSFRDEAVLSMEAVGLASFKSCLIEQNNMKLLPGVAIYGKNGGGKSNVKMCIRDRYGIEPMTQTLFDSIQLERLKA